MIRGELSTFRNAIATVRSTPGADRRWQQLCDLLEGVALLLAGRPSDAVDVLSWAAATVSNETRNFVAVIMLAEHLTGNHGEVTRLMRMLDDLPPAPTATFSDLIGGLGAVTEAVGRHDVPASRKALQNLLDTTDREYPHLVTAYGFGLQAAAVVAHLTDRPEDAVTLLAGSEHHGLHYRYEGAEALGRAYGERSVAHLTRRMTTAAQARGRHMSIASLLSLARSIANDVQASEHHP
jgi:hypothetical protein